MLRLYAALEASDADSVREMFSTGPHLLNIGTDPQEWWTGVGGTEIFIKQTVELGQFQMRPGQLSAYAFGSAGWIADGPTMVLSSGAEVPMRLTAVLAIERGHWRIMQWHCSIGQTSETLFGRILPHRIDALERSVRTERTDVKPATAAGGTVTIAFTDIESSTVLLDRLGDAEFMKVLAWHDRIVREATAQQNGHVGKSQGDGFMLAFLSSAFALRSSLVMRERLKPGFNGLPVRIRIGLHAGETINTATTFTAERSSSPRASAPCHWRRNPGVRSGLCLGPGTWDLSIRRAPRGTVERD